VGILATGQSFLNTRLGTAGGVSCVYTRGVNSVAIAGVWLGGFDSQAEKVGERSRIESGTPDVLIPVAGLVLAGCSEEPAEGDTITLTVNGIETTLVVAVPSSGVPCWQYSDHVTRTRYRVHCREAN